MFEFLRLLCPLYFSENKTRIHDGDDDMESVCTTRCPRRATRLGHPLGFTETKTGTRCQDSVSAAMSLRTNTPWNGSFDGVFGFSEANTLEDRLLTGGQDAPTESTTLTWRKTDSYLVSLKFNLT